MNTYIVTYKLKGKYISSITEADDIHECTSILLDSMSSDEYNSIISIIKQ